MKFVKLKFKNFKPYYDVPNRPQEIVLFDKERKDKNLTLNIGPTGHGKTSISEAILWCLFGDNYYKKWEELVNALAIEVAKQKKEDEVDISVELVLEIKGEHYRIIRSGSYDINKQEKVKESELSIIHDGEPIKNPTSFTASHFPTLTLMKYFIFDADDILKRFEEDREITIKDHINKIVGVEKLDSMINAFGQVMEFYEEDIRNIVSQIHNDVADKIKEIGSDKAKKEEAIEGLKKEVQGLEKNKKELFKASPSSEVTQFSELVDKRDSLKRDIEELNKRFVEDGIISDMDLLLLDCIIDASIKKLDKKQTTSEEFETSTAVIKSSLKDDYSGLFFDEKENTCLIKKGARIWNEDLDNLEKLDLKSGEGTKSGAMKIFREYRKRLDKKSDVFKHDKKNFDEKMGELMRVRSQIKQLGDTTKNKEFKDKYDRFKEIESRIREKEKLQDEIQEKIEDAKKEIESLNSELEKDEERQKEIERIKERKKVTKTLLDISKRGRKEFLDDLLSTVNKTASESLRSTVRDSSRFHSIEIDNNYQFKVKRKNGEPLEESQINRGNLQISMMSFFFGLSKFLGKDIPYVIDDPLLRLDPGHDKRLIEQLSKANDQLIFHMIPGKEYTSDSFDWLKPHINTQNWLNRKRHKWQEISYAERKDADKFVKFDIDKF